MPNSLYGSVQGCAEIHSPASLQWCVEDTIGPKGDVPMANLIPGSAICMSSTAAVIHSDLSKRSAARAKCWRESGGELISRSSKDTRLTCHSWVQHWRPASDSVASVGALPPRLRSCLYPARYTLRPRQIINMFKSSCVSRGRSRQKKTTKFTKLFLPAGADLVKVPTTNQNYFCFLWQIHANFQTVQK